MSNDSHSGDEPALDEELATRQDIDEADIILISPFDHEVHRKAKAFQERVILPAISEAEATLGRAIQVVRLNRRLAGSDADMEMAYRAMHLAELCIADVTDYDHRALSYLSMRLVLSKGPAIAIDRNQHYRMVSYPRPVADIALYAGQDAEQEADVRSRVKAKVIEAMGPTVAGERFSPVYKDLEALSVSLRGSDRKKGKAPQYRQYALSGLTNSPRVAIAVGDIRMVKGVDVWVNPENTHLEMARVFDTSISGTIRHLSSKWTGGGTRSDDFMRRQVAQKLPAGPVEPGFAQLTSTKGDLKSVNLVKAVAHVAAVELKGREPGAGYRAVSGDKIAKCVTGVLSAMDDSNKTRFQQPLRTVIIPLIGSYASPQKAERNAMEMVRAIVAYFSPERIANSKIKGVALLGYTDEDERLITKAFRRIEAPRRLEDLSKTTDEL
ncbi:MAG: hypothetical protein AAFX86_01300 [Pseudomonadota bacterium]